MTTPSAGVPAIRWSGDQTGSLYLLDQTLLPVDVREVECDRVEAVWEAIRKLRVRGAPAIGVAAAYGVVVGCRQHDPRTAEERVQRLDAVTEYLAGSRPTAVNLFWALKRMSAVGKQSANLATGKWLGVLLKEAQAIEEEDRAMCDAIGQAGARLLENCQGILTHCNTGGLATAGDGTALAAIFAAARHNPDLKVYADETRPLLQGARLTAWELMQRGVDVTLICDSMAALVMQQRRVQAVIVGADRIAANGDSANKVGTYGLSVLAKAHGVPFYVAAPSSTFDLSLESGALIPIEERPAEEITQGFGRQTAPTGCHVFNPAFDVAPAENITALITEQGVISPVSRANIERVLGVKVKV